MLTSVAADGKTSVYIDLTLAGLHKLAAAPGQQLVVDYSTSVKSIPADGLIKNQAWTMPGPKPVPGDSLPTPPTTPPPPPETPETPTNEVVSKFGKIRINKVGVTGVEADQKDPLANAVFEVYQITVIPSATDPRIPADACTTAGIDGQTPILDNLTTDADGNLDTGMLRLSNWYNDGVEQAAGGNNDGYLDGSQYADKYGWRVYCLVEVEAPNGYQLLAEPVTYVLTQEGDLAQPTVPYDRMEIVNQADNVGNQLPLTGGEGIAALSIGGLLLIGGGVAYYVATSRKRKVAA